MKSFRQFLKEAYLMEGQSREDAEKKRLEKENPNEWRVRKVGRAGEESWTTKRKISLSGQATTRRKNLRGLSYQEILSAVKRDLSIPNSEVRSVAKKAHSTERSRKATQTRTRNRLTQETGKEHNVDHIVPQPNRRPEALRSRFQAIHPGDASDNREVEGARENREKNSKNTRTTLTRSGAVRRALDRAK